MKFVSNAGRQNGRKEEVLTSSDYPLSSNVPLLYPVKTSENRRFSDFFSGYRSRTLIENGLVKLNITAIVKMANVSHHC